MISESPVFWVLLGSSCWTTPHCCRNLATWSSIGSRVGSLLSALRDCFGKTLPVKWVMVIVVQKVSWNDKGVVGGVSISERISWCSRVYLIRCRWLSKKRRTAKIKWNKGVLKVAGQNNKQIWGSSFCRQIHRSNKSNNFGEKWPAEKIKWTLRSSHSWSRKDIGWVWGIFVGFNGWENDTVLSFSRLKEILLSQFLMQLLLNEQAPYFVAARNLLWQWFHWHLAFCIWNYLVPNFL